MPFWFLVIGLTLIAALSPLLTFAHLWQIKEWRMDRLRAHFQEEGLFRQLFGIVRPFIVTAIFLLVTADRAMIGFVDARLWYAGAGIMSIVALDLLFCIQLLIGRQPRPVWTAKAIMIVATSLLLDAIITLKFSILNSQFSILLPLLVLLQPFILAFAYALFRPLDYFLKRRIIERAIHVRSEHPNLTVIGITGSAGKTTTKELLAHILADQKPIVTPAHMNADVGIAKWLTSVLKTPPPLSPPPPFRGEGGNDVEGGLPLSAPAGRGPGGWGLEEKILIAELGAYRSGEIALLCQILKPSIGIITFIGTQHLALFGSQEALCSAKAELLDALPTEGGHAFLNADSALCAGLKEHCPCPVTTVGTGGISDLEATDIEEVPTGISFTADSTRFVVPLHGTHTVTNILLAIACAKRLGITLETIAKRLLTFAPPSRTFQLREERGVKILDDTHNSSAASFKAAIAWARTQPEEPRILLSSGLIELGEEQERTHRELGAFAVNVFENVIFLHKRSGEQFAKGFGKPVTILSKKTPPVLSGSLLVCVGRMPPATINQLLP